MRRVIKPVMVTGIIVLCLVVVTGGFYAYLSFNAHRIFNAQASSLTKRHVRARVVRAQFPASVLVEGLSVDGILTCDWVRASVDAASLFGRDIHIRTLEFGHPVVTWEKDLAASAKDQPAEHKPLQEGAPKNVILAELVIHDGVLKFVTKSDAGASKEYVVDGIQLRAHNVPLTDTPARTEFLLTSSLVRLDVPFVGHFLKAGGWLNWAAKDMDAFAQVMDDNGRIGLDAKLASRQNDMTVFGDVVLSGAQEPQATGKKSGMVENVVLNMMMATNTDMEMGFSFKTKMDHVDIGTVNLSGHITTGLNSRVTSGNIVAGLKAATEELLKSPEDLDADK